MADSYGDSYGGFIWQIHMADSYECFHGADVGIPYSNDCFHGADKRTPRSNNCFRGADMGFPH